MPHHVTFRRNLLLLLISGLAGSIWLMWSLLSIQSEYKVEQERLALYWNGYAKLYYEVTGDWRGLEERLERDRYMQAGEVLAAAIFYDAAGSEIASIGDQHSIHNARKLPILSDGVITGYTIVEAHYLQEQRITAIVITLSVFVLVYLGSRYHLYKLRMSNEAADSRIAARLLHKLSDTQSTSDNVRLDQVEQALEAMLDKIKRLETVRRTMVAEIAHELRTPLAIMRTQLENALHNGQPLPMEKVISLHEENIRLSRLVQDLQELSLAESGHLPLDKSWFSLTELMESVMDALAVEGEDRSIQTRFTASQEIRIHADQARIRQVIVNLLGNAYKHARSTINIRVQLDNLDAIVTVTDDGWGIEEEDLKHVFDRFYRAGHRGGIGLGLAIVKEFVSAHRGTVRVESQFGEGASFEVRLPVITE